MKQIYFFLFIGIFTQSFLAQTTIGIYDFSFIPQTNLENPSYSTGNTKHISIPFLGNVQMFGGFQGATLYDVFADNDIPIEEKLKQTIYGMSSKDQFYGSQKMDIINIGKIHGDGYLSFGIYQEATYLSNFPQKMGELFIEGTTYLNKPYSLENFQAQFEVTTVYHIGKQTKWNDNTNFGMRFKFYNQPLHAHTDKSNGTIYVKQGTVNLYSYNIENVDVNLKTSGFEIDNDKDISKGYILGKMLFTGNKGVGFDIGIIKNINSNLIISSSLLDVGFIYHNKPTKTFSAKGDFQTEGINYVFNAADPADYWYDLIHNFNESLNYTESKDKFITLRPIQWNTMLKYSLDKKRMASCNYNKSQGYDREFNKAIGFFSHVQMYNGNILPSASIFYEHYFSDFLDVRVAYTVDKFSASNIGVTASAKMGKFNLYTGVDNIIGLTNLAKTHSVSAIFGMNLIWK